MAAVVVVTVEGISGGGGCGSSSHGNCNGY